MDTLSSCFSHFKEGKPPALVVLDEQGNYQGMVARRWILRSQFDPTITKVETLMQVAPIVSPHDSLNKAARLMLETEIRQLPVYSGEKLLGVVTDEDIIQGIVREEWGTRKIEAIMSPNPFIVDEETSVGEILSIFRDQDISHVPVVQNGKLVGIVSVHDIIEHIYHPRERQTLGERVGEKLEVLGMPAKGIMVSPVISVPPDATLKETAQKMSDFDISSVVVAKDNNPVGIITKRDFLEPLIQKDIVDRRLKVQFSLKDVEITELQKKLIMDDFEAFAQRYSDALGAGILFIYMKTHGTNYKGDPLTHCRLHLRTNKGPTFFSSSEGYGIEQIFRVALERLERQVLRSKTLEYDPEFARTYLRRLRFPLNDR